jgi:hypothetical protein
MIVPQLGHHHFLPNSQVILPSDTIMTVSLSKFFLKEVELLVQVTELICLQASGCITAVFQKLN